LTTQKTYLNNNTELQLSLKFEEVESKEKKEINQNNEFSESVTLGILNSEEYTRKLIRASRESFIFDYEKDYKDLSAKFNDSKDEDEDDTKISNTKNEKSYNKLYNDLDFNPNDSPIIVPGKLSNDVIDYSKNFLFKHSNSSKESLSSSNSYEHSNKTEIERRVSNKKTGKRDIYNDSDNEEFSFFNNIENQNKSRSYSLPRRIDIKKVENNRSRSNTLPRSMINSPTKDEELYNSSSPSKDIYSFYDMIISPAKDEKFYVCTSPKKDTYNLYDLSTIRNAGIDKNNYNLYEDDDKNSFVYSQFDLMSPLACDFNEYRNILKSKNTETFEKNEERVHRSHSRSTHGSLYRSLSRNGEMKETSEEKRKSRSRSRSLSRSRSRSKHRDNSSSRNNDGEGKYRSLSRTRSDKEKEHRESRSKERKNRERRESRSKNKEHRESRGKNKEHRESRIKDKEYRESKSKEKRHSSSRHRRSSHTHRRNKSSSNDSLCIKNSSISSKNSNYGSPLVRSNSRSSPLASNVINNKFSTSYIQDHEGKNSPSTKLIDLNVQKKAQLPFDNMKNENNKFITIGESKNMEIINEISDLKKFSQEFSGLSILEDILNRPLEGDYDYDNLSTYNKLTYNSPSTKFSTISRLSSQTNKNSHDLKRRNSDMDFPVFEKSHNRTNSDRSRNMQESKGNKKNIFNFFSNHKKSKSYSSLPSEKSFINNSSNNSGKYNNNYDKIKLKQSNKISIRDDDSDSDINNSDYASSYINFLNETKKNTNFILANTPPLNNIKDYTPLFKINHMNQLNTVNYFGSKGELVNPYDQFNDFDFNDNSKIENNKRPIMNQKMSSSYTSQSKGYQIGNKRY
jgi:hypothetical protein